MTMQYDVKSTHLTASGDVTSNRARLKSVSYRGDGQNGYIKFRDGSVTGTVLMELDVGTSDSFTIYLLIPGEGILFPTSIYAELSHVSAITAIWG